MQTEDILILNEIKAGNEKAYNAFYKGYKPRLQATIYFLCNDEQLSEDIAQEAFLRLWENRARLNEYQSIKGYLRTISNNLFFDHKRKSKSSNVYQELLKEPVVNDVEEHVIFNELNSMVFSAISKFSQDKQEMYIGNRFQGKTYNEIALAKNTTPKAVERHISKISYFIKEHIKKHYYSLLITLIYLFL